MNSFWGNGSQVPEKAIPGLQIWQEVRRLTSQRDQDLYNEKVLKVNLLRKGRSGAYSLMFSQPEGKFKAVLDLAHTVFSFYYVLMKSVVS